MPKDPEPIDVSTAIPAAAAQESGMVRGLIKTVRPHQWVFV